MMYRKAGELAPGFSLPDSQSGAATALDTVVARGGETLLVWIKLGCPTCQLLMPFVERIHRKVRGRADRRVLVVTQDPANEVPRFRGEFHCETVPFLCEAPPYAAADQYGITSTPTCFLLDAGRRVLWSEAAFNRQGLEELFARFVVATEDLFTPEEALTLPAFRPG